MRRFSIRWRGGHRVPEVEAEAQRDLQHALQEQVEALRRENDALRRQADLVPQLQHRLALALVMDFMHTALRQRASVRLERTVELPRRDLQAPTEYFPIHRRR